MGEVKIKSGNLFDLEGYITKAAYVHNIEITLISNGISIIATSSDDPYINPSYNVVGQQIPASTVKRAVINCKPNTAYTLSLHQSQNVSKRISYFNSEFTVIKGYDSFNGTIFNMITPENCAYILIRIGDSATLSEGTMVELTNIQLLEGTYTSETIPEYQPYFLNRPAHQFVNGQWVDIPTHHYVNGRWQGELTSQSPLKFWADGEMLDWRVEGASGGVGDWDETAQKYKIPIWVEGKNLFDGEWKQGTILSPSSANRVSNKNAISLKTNTVYTIGLRGSSIIQYALVYRDRDGEVTYDSGWHSIAEPVFSSTAEGTSAEILIRRSDAGSITPVSEEILNLKVIFIEGKYTSETLPPYEVNLFADHQLLDGDSIDYTTDQTAIPIATGNNTLTVDTAVQPKSVFVKFEG